MLFIAHDLAVVKYFCSRVGVMYRGQLMELAASEELFAHPLHPYTRSLLSAIPLPDPRAQRRRTRIPYVPEAASKSVMRQLRPEHWVRCTATE